MCTFSYKALTWSDVWVEGIVYSEEALGELQANPEYLYLEVAEA